MVFLKERLVEYFQAAYSCVPHLGFCIDESTYTKLAVVYICGKTTGRYGEETHPSLHREGVAKIKLHLKKLPGPYVPLWNVVLFVLLRN